MTGAGARGLRAEDDIFAGRGLPLATPRRTTWQDGRVPNEAVMTINEGAPCFCYSRRGLAALSAAARTLAGTAPTGSPATRRTTLPGARPTGSPYHPHTFCVASARARVAVWMTRAKARRGMGGMVQLRHNGAFLLTRTSVRTLAVPRQLKLHRGGSEGSPWGISRIGSASLSRMQRTSGGSSRKMARW